MNRIEYDGPGELYISDISAARTEDKSHLDRVITVCQDNIEDNISDEMEYSFYCMADGPHNSYGGRHDYDFFADAADELYHALANDEAVLIHCHQGTSRSIAVATASLGRLLEIPRSESIDIIHYYRPRPRFPDRLLMSHASDYISEYTENF